MKKNLSIHVTLALMVSLLLTIFLAGCNGTESIKDSSAGIISDSEDGTKSAAPLADYDGWWYIDEDSHDGVSLIEIFHLNALAEKYTVYSEEGFPAATLSARKGDTGELILDLEFFGEVPMVLLDSNTLTVEGGMTFRRGEPLPEPDYSSFAGIWYESGDEKGNYYRLSNDGSYEYCDVHLNEYTKTKEATETGSYTFSTMTRRVSDSKSFESLCLTLDDGSGFTDDFYLLESGAGLLDGGFDDTFYIRSDALGTSSGEDAISFCTLVQTNLWHGDDGNYLYFVEGGIFKLSSPNEKGEIKPYDGGAWSLTGEELLLVWDNGVKETVAFRAGDGISVPSLNEIFTAAR